MTRKITQMADSPRDARVETIAQLLSDLLDEQMKAITGRGLDDLTHQEAAVYEVRRAQIAVLRAELNVLARLN